MTHWQRGASNQGLALLRSMAATMHQRTPAIFLVLCAFEWTNAAFARVATRIDARNVELTVSQAVEDTHNAFGSDTTGTRIWDAGRVLSTVLSERDCTGLRVLELGAGTGVGGLTAAAAGAAHVVLTDGAAATMPLLAENVETNGLSERVRCARMRWGWEDEMDTVAALGPFDLICGSDLLCACSLPGWNPAQSLARCARREPSELESARSQTRRSPSRISSRR